MITDLNKTLIYEYGIEVTLKTVNCCWSDTEFYEF